MTSRTQLALAGVLAALVLAGCSSGATPPGGTSTAPTASTSAPASPAGAGTPAVGQHVDADVQFATMMIPHHTQAVAMSDMLLSKQGVDAKVTALATRIKAEQAPQIVQMSGWLAGWGQDPSPSSMGGMGGMGAGDGLMSQADMDALDHASGDDAARLYLTGMIKHHQGAVTMAQTELAQGENPDAKKLAQSIVTTQKAEITEMNGLLGG
ncbi:Uncharacterized conserved protein, DUF305 family [Microlunatus sagamiharensis]|uniref:Uncharacterized conserved protein, DUF305 family n=1 Tax=Microlunatus sagamiharensis TaxID=546874 RepID=A0A1H2M519_9ACTN|nr:DUF305 domain-containing protein [Microlunatus sagamiharensis]SDU88038.1 Uncharacterized conserved protein, DUF305 family [Microlunatus sagamiharensis]